MTTKALLFVRWVNKALCERLLKIESLGDLGQDGMLLIQLLEILFKKNIGRYNKAPKLRLQKVENIFIALRFLKEQELVLPSEIHPEDIIDKNEKMLMEFVWCLIKRSEVDGIAYKNMTGTDALLQWCRDTTAGYTNVHIPEDFRDSSWSDGQAFAALIHKHRPDLVNIDTILESDDLVRCRTVFDVVKSSLDIVVTPILDREQHAVLEEREVIAFVAQLYHHLTTEEQQQTFERTDVEATLSGRELELRLLQSLSEPPRQ
eukprot:TRINITY_DN7752_c0_g1_i1.p1 TRINITY_DN7752_c0_g1~~TRINITY_DN7752_c0_g1_i1.p1  ORF type:complete len:271 (+),score=56.60 TRINITY_DN7752_c0_g1_i1:32-814(+)